MLIKIILLICLCGLAQILNAQAKNQNQSSSISAKEKEDSSGALLATAILNDKATVVMDEVFKKANSPRWEYWIKGHMSLPNEGEKPTKEKINKAKSYFEQATFAGWYPAYQELALIHMCNSPRTSQSLRDSIEIHNKGLDYHGTKNSIAYLLLYLTDGNLQENITTSIKLVNEALSEINTWGEGQKFLVRPFILHTAAFAYYLQGNRERSVAYVNEAQSILDELDWPMSSEKKQDIKRDFSDIKNNKKLKLSLSSIYLECDLLTVPQ